MRRISMFALVAVLRSPPDPFTHISSTASPVRGSFSRIFAEVLPPPVFVIRWSDPN